MNRSILVLVVTCVAAACASSIEDSTSVDGRYDGDAKSTGGTAHTIAGHSVNYLCDYANGVATTANGFCTGTSLGAWYLTGAGNAMLVKSQHPSSLVVCGAHTDHCDAGYHKGNKGVDVSTCGPYDVTCDCDSDGSYALYVTTNTCGAVSTNSADSDKCGVSGKTCYSTAYFGEGVDCNDFDQNNLCYITNP
jgi:hypothetical protein